MSGSGSEHSGNASRNKLQKHKNVASSTQQASSSNATPKKKEEKAMKALGPMYREEEESLERKITMQNNVDAHHNRGLKNVARVRRPCTASGCKQLPGTNRYCAVCFSFVHFSCCYMASTSVSIPNDLTKGMALACSEKCFHRFMEVWNSDQNLDLDLNNDSSEKQEAGPIVQPLEKHD